MKNILAFFPLLILLCGCFSPYVAPPNKPKAFLYVEKHPKYNFAAHTYEKTSDCSNRKVLVAPFEHSKEIAIQANREFVFTLSVDIAVTASSTGISGVGCVVSASFVPEENVVYFTKIQVLENSSCSIVLAKKTNTGMEEVKFKLREWKGGMSEGWCKKE